MALVNVPSETDRIGVLVADDTAMSTQLLVDTLTRAKIFNVTESPLNSSEILTLVEQQRPGIALVGAKLGSAESDSWQLTREIRASFPHTRVIVLLDSSQQSSVVDAFRSGASGVFCRTEPVRLLAKCIQCVHSGQVWASSQELHYVLEALNGPALASLNVNGGSLLSARELDVVRCVAEGLTNREIAQRLKLTEHTVKNYLFRIFDKLGVSNRVEVVLYALTNASSKSASSPASSRREWQPAHAPARASGTVPINIRKTAT
jgi:two-component system nitrate/nitrite response regulator NarL